MFQVLALALSLVHHATLLIFRRQLEPLEDRALADHASELHWIVRQFDHMDFGKMAAHLLTLDWIVVEKG